MITRPDVTVRQPGTDIPTFRNPVRTYCNYLTKDRKQEVGHVRA
jgi:hypothetical protein